MWSLGNIFLNELSREKQKLTANKKVAPNQGTCSRGKHELPVPLHVTKGHHAGIYSLDSFGHTRSAGPEKAHKSQSKLGGSNSIQFTFTPLLD